MSPADPWSGIPDDLRRALNRVVNTAMLFGLGSSDKRSAEMDEAQVALCAALRALVADRERIEWMESRRADYVAALGNKLWTTTASMREAIDEARGATPGVAKEEAE